MDSLFMALAAAEAEKYVGATSPNPPVGACLVKDGRMLAVGAHQRAGTDHAEVVALKAAIELVGSSAIQGATLYVTLEPCNHQGKTPPCTRALIEAGISRVVFGARDPNKAVTGGGARALAQAGLLVTEGVLATQCERLISPFRKWTSTKRPWVVHKLALRLGTPTELTSNALSMLPDAGKKTFTSVQSLREAHLERRKADAILTGLTTVNQDLPLFNVRHLVDHPGKQRWLAVLSRRGRLPSSTWINRQEELGFKVLTFTHLDTALQSLGERGALRVLIEAGPTLSQVVRQERLWDERLIFISSGNLPDLTFREYACSQES